MVRSPKPRSRSFQILRKTIEKRVKYDLHHSTLKSYSASNLVPKGLSLKMNPAMTTLDPEEQALWNKTLHDASLQLMQIIIDHSERKYHELKEAERLLRCQRDLSAEDLAELASYENQKTNQIKERKHRKLERDGISRIINTNTKLPTTPTDANNGTATSLSTVINLSSAKLSASEISLLSKGLTFCPASGKFNEFQLYQDLDNFSRNLRLREFFHDHKPSHITFPGSSQKSWSPPEQRDKHLEMYISAVQKDIIAAFSKLRPFRNNLTTEERKSLEYLSRRSDVVIKPADKGGALVILDKADYLKEGFRQLKDKKFYMELAQDPTKEFEAEINRVLTSLHKNGKISADMLRAMQPFQPAPGRFYLLPKIHKTNHPGRPIVSSNGTVTERISSALDFIIKDIVPTIPSYVKDTNHFLRQIAGLEVPKDSILVTMDVTSLYTNIPHSDGIEATVSTFKKTNTPVHLDEDTLSTLLRLVLSKNNFEFDNKHFLQINGTAMGTRMAPNYANIFMASIEEPFLAARSLKPLMYKRFLDDIFLIWNHGEESLLTFLDDFNSAHPSISFTYCYSKSTINFLDVTVEIRGNRIHTNLYKKPTDRHQYLHFKSSHPRHCKTAIPYSQAHRYRRICTDTADFEGHAKDLKTALVAKDYPESIIDDAIDRARTLDRDDALTGSKLRHSKNNTNLVLTYSSTLPHVNNILSRHFNIIQQSTRLSSIFTEPPKVVYRRGRNLKDMLVRAKTTGSEKEEAGCRPCGKQRCQVCKHMTTTCAAKATHSDFTFRINEPLNCDSQNVVYLLHCEVCNQQYIGQTGNAFRLRLNNHRAHARTLPSLPFSKHLMLPEHSFDKIRVTLLQSGFHSAREREQRESYFIHKFKTVTHGINENIGPLSFLRA